MNQRDPKTGCCLGNRNGNKGAGFKRTQNNKHQANQMQGNQSRAFVNRDTWNSLGDSDKKAWDQLSDPAKTKITAHHFNKGKEHAAQDSEANKMEAKEHDLIFDDSDGELEAKQHDLMFDDSEEDEEESLEANNFESLQVSNAETAQKTCEDEGVDFDMVLQAQQADTRLQARTHELLDSDSSDEESAADMEVNVHKFKHKIQGSLEFSDSDDETEQDPDVPAAMAEAQALEAQDKDDDQSVEQKETAKMFEGMLHFSDSEDEDEAKHQLRICGFTSSIEETVNADGTDAFGTSGDEGVVGEQEGDVSNLTNSDTDRRRAIEEFCSHDGLMHFSDSDGEEDPQGKSEAHSKKKTNAGVDKEETKAMTRNEHRKAGVAPPPASKAPHPTGHRARSLSPKSMSSKSALTASSHNTPKVPIATQVVHQTPVPEQASTKTFAFVASTPKSPAVTKPQQASTEVMTPTKPLQTKSEAKKTPPSKGKPAPKKDLASKKQVTVSQKAAEANKQIAVKAKQADKSDSPKMKEPFDKVNKPTKTADRIVETPDGKSCQLLSEEEKTKADKTKKFELLGLLHFSDDEEDESSLETVVSDKSQGSQKQIAKPSPKKPSNQMKRTGSKQVKETELTPFHKDALSSAGGLATPAAKGSSAGGWTVQGSGKRTPNVCQQFAPKALGNMLHLRNPLDQQAATRATDLLHSKTTRKKKSAKQQPTSCLLTKFLSRSKKALPQCNQTPTKQQSTLKQPLPNKQLKIRNPMV